MNEMINWISVSSISHRLRADLANTVLDTDKSYHSAENFQIAKV